MAGITTGQERPAPNRHVISGHAARTVMLRTLLGDGKPVHVRLYTEFGTVYGQVSVLNLDSPNLVVEASTEDPMITVRGAVVHPYGSAYHYEEPVLNLFLSTVLAVGRAPEGPIMSGATV